MVGEVEPAISEAPLLVVVLTASGDHHQQPLEAESRMEGGGQATTTTDTGLTSLRSLVFLVLWYFFSGT